MKIQPLQVVMSSFYLQLNSLILASYEITLPWKEHPPDIPDHLALCQTRLKMNALKLKLYCKTMTRSFENNETWYSGVGNELGNCPTQAVHYLPHHGVISTHEH